jgi:hypothetical protein
MSASKEYDVVMLSDLRLPGGTTVSMAEEIRAQATAGYRTALVQLNSPLVKKNLGVSVQLRRCLDEGLAELVLPGGQVSAGLAVLRHPTVFGGSGELGVEIDAGTVALVANNTAADASGTVHYDPMTVNDVLTQMFGVKPTWHPIGPVVRDSLGPFENVIQLASRDWVNVIDIDEWTVDRRRGPRSRPVIGRHSRPQPAKWPTSAAELLAAYPDSDEFVVRILGGAAPALRLLGSIPKHWIVEDFGRRDPRDFLADIDFFVYFHHPDLLEAFGRTIMEALASGAVVVLPEHFRQTFGDAAVYTDPDGVAAVVRSLVTNPAGYAKQSQRGIDFINHTYGYGVHVARVAELVGPARSPTRPISSRRRDRQRARVMFVSSNGAGMGHLTRLLAMASRSSKHVEPLFFSLSQAVSVVSTYGYPWEYCPSRGDLDLSTREWNPLFSQRLHEVMCTYQPAAVVFDGTWPYRGLRQARSDFPDVAFVWSRRGMWREGTDGSHLVHSMMFDLVVEPGEVAGEFDHGPTAERDDAIRVDPITLIGQDQLLDRGAARAELGMDTHDNTLLVSLGAGNINDTASTIRVIVDAAGRHGWQAYIVKAPISRDHLPDMNVRPLSIYPLARYLRAFDAGVTAAGYNSYHEMIMAALPSIFVPNLETMTDDQHGRARYAESVGLGLCLSDVTIESANSAFERLADSHIRRDMARRAAATYPGNGAETAMAAVETLLASRGVIA